MDPISAFAKNPGALVSEKAHVWVRAIISSNGPNLGFVQIGWKKNNTRIFLKQ
jgi:hypothetical protein